MNTANKHQTGLSLIELMVAIVIGSLLLLGAASLMINNKRIYQTQDQLGRMQESARFAIQRMFHDISMAGYFGCTGKGGSITNNLTAGLATAGADYDISDSVEGFDNATSTVIWQPSKKTFSQKDTSNKSLTPHTGTDGITVRGMSGMSYRLQSAVTSQTADVEVAIPADVEPDNAIEEDDYVMIADCKGADIFQATGVASAGRTLTLEHAGLDKLYENYENNDGATPVARVAKLNISRYYIAASSKGPHPNGDPRFSLYRNNIELVEGIRDMQVLYGINNDDKDKDPNATPDEYVNAAAGIDWSNVVSVKITLTFESTDRNYADSAADPEWVYTTTIRIRNNTGAVI